MPEIRCGFCAQAYQAKTRRSKFCSNNCKQRALTRRRSPLIAKACDVCGVRFQQKKRHQRYCSMLCYTRGWAHNNRGLKNKHQREYMKARRVTNYKILLCEGCDTEFQQHHAKQKFCSDKCARRIGQRVRMKTLPKEVKIAYYDAYRARDPWRYVLMTAKSRSKVENIPYNLDKEWAVARWTGSCELCRLPFVIAKRLRHPLSPSIDKIDPTKGYTKDNCRFVAWAINAFKGTGTDEEMLTIARALIDQIPPPHRP